MMPGNKVTKQQVKLYMKTRSKGCTQATSSARAGISVSSGQRIEAGNHSALSPTTRSWRTRDDPFGDVWDSDIKLLLEESPDLTPLTILEYIQDRHPEQYPDSLLRTMQRRVKQWKALNGKAKEIIFRQEHAPGRFALSDFTKLKGVEITIQKKPLRHLLYHFRLAYSGWSYLKVVLGGESYTALTEGLQEALWCVGGSPFEHRTDSLSAAFKNSGKETRKDLTQRYEQFCRHYNMEPTRNNLGISHENGGIEGPHGHLKRRIKQALLLRKSNDFDNISEYQNWMNEVTSKHNRRNAKNVALERSALQPLPSFKTLDYAELVVPVHSTGTININNTTYSVPSCFCGERLRVHLYDSKLRCYLGSNFIIELPRIYTIQKNKRARLINYRHLIESLMKKPQAFRYSQIRDDILPSPMYRRIWLLLDKKIKGRESCKLMVGILSVAAKFNCEKELGNLVLKQLINDEILNIEKLRQRFSKNINKTPQIEVNQHSLDSYDDLLVNKEVTHA
jgi:hypothetical protein